MKKDKKEGGSKMGRKQKVSKKIQVIKAYMRFGKEEMIEMINMKLTRMSNVHLARLLAEMDGF